MSYGDDILDFDPIALVVFTKENTHHLSWVLHPERRHCFAVIPGAYAASTSVEVNLTKSGVVMTPAGGSPDELIPHYEKQGLEVVEVPYRPAKRQLLPTVTNSCVGLTKQLIGIRSWAMTPHQLWRHLTMEGHVSMNVQLDLTLPGFGGPSTPSPPPPPDPLPAPPTMADARRARGQFSRMRGTRNPANVTNQGGGGGIAIEGSVNQALKSLTGQ